DTGESSEPAGSTTGPAGSAPIDSSAPPDDTGAEPSGDPNPSGFPEPGAGGVPRPSGAAGNLKVVPWAGFSGALSYSFDDATGSQHGNKAAMLALDAKFTFYLT